MSHTNMNENDNNKPEVRSESQESSLVDVFESEADEATKVLPAADVKAAPPAKKREKRKAVEEEVFEVDDSDIDIEARDYRPIRMRRDGRLGCLGGLMYAVFIICISVILACFGWMCASDVLALNKTERESTITLSKDAFSQVEKEIKDENGKVTGKKTVTVADIDHVAQQLKNGGLIEYKWLFKLYAQISNAGEKVAPGTYKLSTSFDYRALVKNMDVGTESMVPIKITFPEGYTMAQIFAKLEENDICTAEELYYAAANYDYGASYKFLENVEVGDAQRLEGFIFPNTYDFYQGEQASSVINKFLRALHYKITADTWKQCENYGFSFKQAMTIASMIEKEAANDEERAIISSVIHNRLNADMTLGIDASILYEFPDFAGMSVPDEIINHDSPYNTRLYKGLPPTPICNPGIASLNAALKPASTNYYYYALNAETGTHEFFTNAAEHQAFVETQNYEQ